MEKNKIIFLDRDGVLNRELGDYVCRLEDFSILEHNLQVLVELQERGYVLVVATNQGGLAKGMYSEDDLEDMHRELKRIYAREGIILSEIYYCRHHPQFNGLCLCRKPGSLMLEKGLARFQGDPAKSYFIGDRERDIQAAEAAGVTGILINSDQPIGEVLHLIA